MFPAYHATDRTGRDPTGVLGTLTRTSHGREDWVDDGWIGFLLSGEELFAGRWNRQGDLWRFVPENPESLDRIRARSDWCVLDGYWGQRAEIVLDRSCRWSRHRFQPADAIRHGAWVVEATDAPADDEELVKDGWDHEHCAICWETIGPGGQPDGYVAESRLWLCTHCYESFVERRSLDFIPSA
jgi:hypothetical protein